MIAGLIDFERNHHRGWMVGSLGLVWALWLVPFLVRRPVVDSELGYTVLLAITAVLIGIGRQGVDLIASRLFVSAMAVVATVHISCSGLGECFNAYEYVVPGLGIFLVVLMWFVAIPVNVAWNRGVGSLSPEFPWRRLATLEPWQQVALGVTVVVALLAYYLSLGIPAY